jgi:hypothetical protein
MPLVTLQDHVITGYRHAFLVFLLVTFSLSPPFARAYELKEFKNYPPLPYRGQYEMIEFRNFPESKLCVAVKDVIKNTSSYERNQEWNAKSYATAKQIVFPAPRNYPVKFIDVRPKYDEKRVKVGYVEYVSDLGVDGYLIDLDNDGVEDLFDITGNKFGIDGAGSILLLYQRVWIFDDQPVPRESRLIKKWISPSDSYFISSDPVFREKFFISSYRDSPEFFPGAFYIDPFSFDKKNYLLFESNEDSAVKLFWVAELLPIGKLITHCYF